MLFFDDCNDEITEMVRIGVQIMDIDVRHNDLIIEYDYMEYDDEALGYCENFSEGMGQSIALNRRIYDSDVDMATVIAHELVHVKQYQDKRLGDAGPLQIVWKGEVFIFDANNYHKQPWEAEAYGTQDFWAHKIRNRMNDLH